jgi:predicted site-specific integrase-resolvase
MSEENNEQNDLYTLRELADSFQVSTKKLREWKRKGALRPIRLERISGPLKYSKRDIEKFLDEHTINKPPEEKDT